MPAKGTDVAKHTPGPWRLWIAQDARPHSIYLGGNLGSIEVQHHHCDFHDPSGALAKEQLCNARLIAISPEMLAELTYSAQELDEAADALLGVIEGMATTNLLRARAVRAVAERVQRQADRARTLIAKATGSSG
jgi:hypothetical protein